MSRTQLREIKKSLLSLYLQMARGEGCGGMYAVADGIAQTSIIERKSNAVEHLEILSQKQTGPRGLTTTS